MVTGQAVAFPLSAMLVGRLQSGVRSFLSSSRFASLRTIGVNRLYVALVPSAFKSGEHCTSAYNSRRGRGRAFQACSIPGNRLLTRKYSRPAQIGDGQRHMDDSRVETGGIRCIHTDSEMMQAGCATSAGTLQYVRKHEGKTGSEHFRTLATPGPAGDLHLSSIGLGTYLGPDTAEADREYEAAIERALHLGVNVIDSAINYRNMRSERAVGRALARQIRAGHVSREEVVVCSKGGFLAFDEIRPHYPGRWIEEEFINPGLMAWSDFMAGCHCMAPTYIANQIDRSRDNLGLETIDVYFLHNPETQLSEISPKELDSRLRAAFQALEEACRAGKIGVYGTATWTGFRCEPQSKDHLSLEDLVAAARDVGGENHHFRIIQAPFNLAMQEAAQQPTQTLKGRQVSLLEAATELGIYVVASASLMQAQLSRGLPKTIGQVFKELPPDSTDAQLAIQFVRTTRGVGTGLVGMRRVAHVEENAAVIAHSAAYRV